MVVSKNAAAELEPLGVSCDKADCDNGLHAYRPGHGKVLDPKKGCKYCGDRSVDWKRTHRRDLSDFNGIMGELQHEWIRHEFWRTDLHPNAINYAKRKGRIELRRTVEHRIRQSVGAARPYRDGGQTPIEGTKLHSNATYSAQHATASCCRKCIEYWWGIARGNPLTNEQVHFLTELCMRYLEIKIPNLSDHGEVVPLTRGNQD